jgi:hypothetical protein
MTSTAVLIAIMFWFAVTIPMSIAVGRYLRHNVDDDPDALRSASSPDEPSSET